MVDKDFQQIRANLISATQQDLPNHLKRLTWSKSELQAFQLARLRSLLSIAKHKTSWYQDRLNDIDVDSFSLEDLQKLPTLNKNDVMQHWDDLISIPGLTRKIAEEHLEKLRQGESNNPYFDNQYLFIATGGSSGVRGLFIWDLNFLKETACINYRFLVHDELKAKYDGSKRMAAIEAPTLLHGSQHLFTINVTSDIEVKSLSVVDPIEKNCEVLSKFQPNYIVGFASYVASVANAQLRGELTIHPRWVSTNSELLDDEMRDLINQVWGIQPCNSWGSVEVGSVAMENNAHAGMIIAEDAVILELVDNNLKPVSDVRSASKLLATCLYNHSMPLIRYVIDDVMNIGEPISEFPAYRVIKSIQGRTTDWFYYDNCKIPPIAFRDILALSKEIDEYQIIQTKDGAIFRLICNTPPNLAEIEKRTIKNLQEAGLSNPQVKIEVVETLPKNPETGKVKRFIPLAR